MADWDKYGKLALGLAAIDLVATSGENIARIPPAIGAIANTTDSVFEQSADLGSALLGNGNAGVDNNNPGTAPTGRAWDCAPNSPWQGTDQCDSGNEVPEVTDQAQAFPGTAPAATPTDPSLPFNIDNFTAAVNTLAARDWPVDNLSGDPAQISNGAINEWVNRVNRLESRSWINDIDLQISPQSQAALIEVRQGLISLQTGNVNQNTDTAAPQAFPETAPAVAEAPTVITLEQASQTAGALTQTIGLLESQLGYQEGELAPTVSLSGGNLIIVGTGANSSLDALRNDLLSRLRNATGEAVEIGRVDIVSAIDRLQSFQAQTGANVIPAETLVPEPARQVVTPGR